MRSYTKFENQIREEVLKKAAEVYPSEDMFCNIKRQIGKERERGNSMNIRNIKKSRGVLIACIVLILTTATCFAAMRIAYYEGHSTNDSFPSFPTEKEMMKQAGFVPDYIENFSNGFNFQRGGVGEASSKDENGTVIDTVKNVSINYEKEGKTIMLGVEDGNLSGEDYAQSEDSIEITKEVKGIFSEEMYKFLPPDYEMTEQDKIDEANGTYIFSYGSEEVEINHIQAIYWNKDGMTYNLMSMDDGVTKDELIAMAAEVIESK